MADSTIDEKKGESEVNKAEDKKPEAPLKPIIKKPKRRRKLFLVLIILLPLLVGGYFLWRYFNTYESTDDAQIDGHINAISARISGHVNEVLVIDQQIVKAGDVLVKIDPRDYEVAVAKAEADVADAKATLESSRTDVPITSTTTASTLKTARSNRLDTDSGLVAAQRQFSAAEARREAARAQVHEAEANYKKAADDVERYRLLVGKEEISEQLYDQAAQTAAAAKATVASRTASLNEAEHNVSAAEAAVVQAQARIEQADASIQSALTAPQQVAVSHYKAQSAEAKLAQQVALLAQAKLNLSYTTIVAPVEGVVGKKTVEVGHNVSPGQQLLAIVQLDDIWVTANFKETQLARMRPGQKVKFSVDASDRDYTGHVTGIGGASGSRFSLLPPENATGNYVKVVQRIPVRIDLDPGQNSDRHLRPGMSVDPKVYLFLVVQGVYMPETTSTTLPAPPPAEERWRPKFNPWLIAVVVALAAFMEVLDTSIANVALPHIAGNLGASNDESTWVLTSYLVSNAIVLPISGWLASLFGGRKRFFLLCIVLFTVSSLLCGAAPSLSLLILFRVIQGLGGGGLQPMAQAILADTFPPQQRGLAFSLYGITAVMAPTVGPTLGGWITDNYSWRWIFYINLPIGILTILLVLRVVEDPPYLARFKAAGIRVDYIGIALLALGIGALQVLLDRGQEDDWFGSRFITTLAFVSAICLISLVIWEWRAQHPVIDVRMFKNFNFATVNLMMFMIGVVYFSSLVMMPQFLQTLMGYTAQLAGMVLSASGILLLIGMPIVGQLTTKSPAKYLIAFGWLSIAIAMYYSTKRIDLEISFQTAMWLRVAQAAGLPFLFVPVTLASYTGLSAEKSNDASGLINFMRNIGSSVGTSMVTTMLARRAQFHQSALSSHTTNFDLAFQNQVAARVQQLVNAGTSAADAQIQAYGMTYQSMQAQAQTLAYIDTFKVLAIGAGIMFLLAFIVKKNDPKAGGEAAAL